MKTRYLTEDQINNLKSGDKIIFVEVGGVLSTSIGNVFTFANWYGVEQARHNSFYEMFPDRLEEDYGIGGRHDKWYFQVQEILDEGNVQHNLPICAIALFNPEIHAQFKIMSLDALKKDRDEFIRKYGAA